MRRVVRYIIETATIGLSHVLLQMDKTRLFLFIDDSFGNVRKVRSHLGYIIVLADDNQYAIILYFGSNRCRRVTRSVMARKVHALVFGFDLDYSLQNLLKEITGRHSPIEANVY